MDMLTVADLRKLDPTLSRQAARKAVRVAEKKADPKRPGPNPTTRTALHGFGEKQWSQTLRLGHDHRAVPHIPSSKYHCALLARLGLR